MDGDSGTLGIGLRNFWQTYPKALTVGAAGIDIGLFPERAGRELPGDEDASHRLYFWLDEEGYKLKAGMALSSEILIDFGGENPAVFDWLEHPVLVRPDIDYLNSTGALNPIGPRRDSPLPDYDALTDRAIDSFIALTASIIAPTGSSTSATGTAKAPGPGATTNTTPATAPTPNSCAAAIRAGPAGRPRRRGTWLMSTRSITLPMPQRDRRPVHAHARPPGRILAALLPQQDGRHQVHPLAYLGRGIRCCTICSPAMMRSTTRC